MLSKQDKIEAERLSDKRLKRKNNNRKTVKHLKDRLFSEVKRYRVWKRWSLQPDFIVGDKEALKRLFSITADIVAIAVKIKYLRSL